MEEFFIYGSLILSVVIGGFLVTYLHSSNKQTLIKLLLSFSGGFLLSIAFIHFVPELYHSKTNNIGIFILIGFLVQLILEYFSGGIEHGHIHIHKNQKMPWGLFISLSIHSFLEGIPLGNQHSDHIIESAHQHGDSSLLLAILFHQLPVAVALMTLLLSSQLSKYKAWLVLVAFGLMTPLGVFIGTTANHTIAIDFNIILAIVVGMFLHISTTIIFETNENHKFNVMKLASILVGCSIAFLVN